MKSTFYLIIFALLFANCTTTHQFKSVKTQSYTAVGIGCFDGDSPTVKTFAINDTTVTDTTYHVRLYGIDAPERPSIYVTKRQPGSLEATEVLRRLVRGKQLQIVPVYTDMFDRSVCRVFVDSIDVSVFMLKNGHAWFRDEANMTNSETKQLKELQATAKRNKIGLWGLAGTKSNPKTWRKKYSGWKER